MRLCFVTPEYVTEPSYSGGLANYLGRVTVALVQKGHEVHVILPAKVNETIDHEGVHVHRVVPLWDRRMVLDHVDRFFKGNLYLPYQETKAAWCLWRRWKQLKRELPFDMVQIANVQGVGFFFRRERRVPVVLRMSSYRPQWDTLAGVEVHTGTRFRWWVERKVAEAAEHLYAPSHHVAKQVETNYEVDHVTVIESPFFQEALSDDRSALEQYGAGAPYCLFFGRMTQMKGVHILADALPAVLAKQPDMRVLLIGRGDAAAPNGQPMRAYVQSHAGEYADRVQLVESMRHDQLYPIVREARFVVLPSLADNLPNTCLESMGLGKLVIATTGSCFEQLIEDERSGLLVEAGDSQQLADAMLRAWNMPDEDRESIGEAAAERMQALHPDVAIPRLIEYYNEIVKSATT